MISSDELVDVTQEGTILLGPDVTCDGFYYGPKVRVQSHVHTDHLKNFSTSKGLQQILMSPESYDLIVLEGDHADIPYRANVKAIKNNIPFKIGESEISVLSNGHMLGAIQTQVTLSNGKRIGYSGDFNWPLENVIKVDTLIVDCTGGSPEKKCHYTLEDVKSRLIELVAEKLRNGPIKLQAYRGTLQYALDLLSEVNIEFVCPSDIYKELEIYQKHGYNIFKFFLADSKEGRELINSERYIYICDTRKHNPAISLDNFVKIKLSAFMMDTRDPVLKLSNKHYSVALSGHADFDGTLAYIKATGAKEVITDNTRAGHAIVLAEEIKSRLNIEAKPSSNELTNDWYH